MNIVDFIPEDLVLPEIRATKKPEVIREIASYLADAQQGVNRDDVVRVIEERERLGSTAIGEGIAIPHGKLDSVGKLVACLGRSRKGVDFESDDGEPTHFFFMLIAPQNSTGDHLKALARISRLFKNPDLRSRLKAAEGAAEMYRIIAEEDGAPR